MGSADILKGVGLHCADALAVDLDVGDGVALIRGDGEGLIPALADADIAGGRNGAQTASDSDGVQRGSTWQCCPGLLVYRRDIAKDVFGTDDPEAVSYTHLQCGN